MHIIVAGGTGFIGTALVKHLLNQKHQITVIGRGLAKIKQRFDDHVTGITWNKLHTDPHIIAKADVVINLTGASIGEKRWSSKRKREIIESRIKSTSMLAGYCAKLKDKAPMLFNANGVGIYGVQKEAANNLPPAIDETTPIKYNEAKDFLSYVGRQWELALKPAVDAGVHVIKMRFGVVFGPGDGPLSKMKLPFLFYIGGPLGSGQQPVSWVSLVDLIAVIEFLIQHKEITGAVNIVSPNCLTQREFAKILGDVLNKPSFLPTPGFILKLILGQMADELLLKGQHVKPKVLMDNGFVFQHADLKSALQIALTH